jgi:hypothetical protein
MGHKGAPHVSWEVKTKGFFSFLRGLRRECAIPCHVASENKKGEFSFILEGVKARGRQMGPHRFCRAK